MAALEAGTLIAEKYRVIRPVARGGFGEVYEAEQSPLKRRVAVKIQRMDLDFEHDPNYGERFLLEASSVASLQHENIVIVHDFGRFEGRLFLILEWLDGPTLGDILGASETLPPIRIVETITQLCRGLRCAHQAGLVHRDIKPGNIVLLKRDHGPDLVKVLDFGLVLEVAGSRELTLQGSALGTPKYMSPEQFEGNSADARTDIYSVGILMYRMLCGRVPFDGTPPVIMMGHVNTPLPPMELEEGCGLSAGLATVALRCLEKNPADRYQSANELLEALALTAVGTSDTVQIPRPDSPPSPLDNSPPVRTPIMRIAAVLVLIVAVTAATYLAVLMLYPKTQASTPETPPNGAAASVPDAGAVGASHGTLDTGPPVAADAGSVPDTTENGGGDVPDEVVTNTAVLLDAGDATLNLVKDAGEEASSPAHKSGPKKRHPRKKNPSTNYKDNPY
jgi:serine/threonine-protein kinase